LASWRPVEIVAHLMQPASVHGKQGLDELFEQTRSILSMSNPEPRAVYGTQVAFNLLPGVGEPAWLLEQLQSILGLRATTAISLTRASVFHCYAASLFLCLENDPGIELLTGTLAASAHVDLASEPELLGPIRGATSDKTLIGAAHAAPGVPGGYWLWGVMDNLASSAANAMAIAATR
jgi:aspartate-semialdehyde dehydrogenase